MLIPFVFELLQGPLLVIPHAMASRSLTPNFIKLRTLVRAIPLQRASLQPVAHSYPTADPVI